MEIDMSNVKNAPEAFYFKNLELIFFAAFIVLLPVIILFGIVCAVPILLLITFFL